MLNVRVRGFRGVAAADITVCGICLVAGRNGVGKTSCLQAIAAALAGNVLPIASLKKSHSAAFVRTGSAQATVEVSTKDGAAQIVWPAAKYASVGTPPQASPYATGLMSVVDLDDRPRAAELSRYLKAEPTREDFERAMLEADFSERAVEKVWQVIEADGWDGALARYRESGTKLKGQWEAVAKEKYGHQKAENWQPEGWEADLVEASEGGLRQDLASAQVLLEAAIAASAIDAHERQRLKALADKQKALAEDVQAKILAHQRAKARLLEAENRLRALPQPAADDRSSIQPCPHCGKALVVDGGVVRRPGAAPDPAEQEAARGMAKEASAAVAAAEQAEQQAGRALEQARAELYEASSAAERLAAMAEPPAGQEAAPVDVARERVRRAEMRLAAFLKRDAADKAHQSARRNQIVVDILSPDGLRARKLAQCVHAFNAQLAELCALAGWQSVTVGPALDLEYAGRPYPLLSASEQYRVRAVLAVAMAAIDGSCVVMLDAADVLDKSGRVGLLRMLARIGRPSIVGMTLDAPEAAPNLAARGMGAAYWIEDGVARPAFTAAVA